MDIKAIKELCTQYSHQELLQFADELENKGATTCKEAASKSDQGALMSDFLQAAEVRVLVDKGMPINEAVREFSKRVRSVVS